MYKVNFKTQSGQKGAVYIVAATDDEAISRIGGYFKLGKQEVEIGLISFQFEGGRDMFIELESNG